MIVTTGPVVRTEKNHSGLSSLCAPSFANPLETALQAVCIVALILASTMKSKEIVMLVVVVATTSKNLQNLVHLTALGLHAITERRKSK